MVIFPELSGFSRSVSLAAGAAGTGGHRAARATDPDHDRQIQTGFTLYRNHRHGPTVRGARARAASDRHGAIDFGISGNADRGQDTGGGGGWCCYTVKKARLASSSSSSSPSMSLRNLPRGIFPRGVGAMDHDLSGLG